jgi:hypothetical protein
MSQYTTAFGSLSNFEKGTLSIINDNPKYYCYSNVFEVASKSKPWEKVAVAKNLEYVIEAIRAEGTSDGEVTVSFIELADAGALAAKDGTQRLSGTPAGRKMGRIHLKKGHQALLPKGAAYQFSAARPSVMIQQTIAGDLTVQKWAEICIH